MPTADQIRAAAAGYEATDSAAAKRLKAAQGLVFGQLAQQMPATAGVRDLQAAAPQLVTQGAETELKAAEAAAQSQVQAGELAQQAESQAVQSQLQQRATAQGLAQTQAAAGQQVAEAEAERAQRVQLTQDEQAVANRVQQAGLDYDASLAFASRKQREDLARLGRDVKQKLFTDRLTFEKDELGRKFSNERQMADYIAATAVSQEAAQDRAQLAVQAHQRKEQLVDRAYQVLGERLRQQLLQAEQERDQVSKKRILEMKAALEREQADRAKKAGALGATVSGAATGAAVAGPYGALFGGAIGYMASQS